VAAGPEVLTRAILVMSVLTISLFFIGRRAGGPGRINRLEGLLLLSVYIAYTTYLVMTAFAPALSAGG
jgi:cation:H+ antiporter